MEGYRNQDGCWNCTKVKVVGHYDSDTTFHCHADRSKRPKYVDYSSIAAMIPTADAWDEWHDARRVMAYGICDKHRKVKT